MKRYFAILLIVLLSLTACGKAAPPMAKIGESVQADAPSPETDCGKTNGKIQLTMAGLHIRKGIMRPIVAAFNEQSQDYEIVMADYSDDMVVLTIQFGGHADSQWL